MVFEFIKTWVGCLRNDFARISKAVLKKLIHLLGFSIRIYENIL